MAKKTFCNMCGKPFDIFDFQNDFSIDRYVSYGSIYDEEHLQLDLCCDCMDDIIASCKIPPMESDEKARLIYGNKISCVCEETEETEETVTTREIEIETEYDDADEEGVDEEIIRVLYEGLRKPPHRVTVKRAIEGDPA